MSNPTQDFLLTSLPQRPRLDIGPLPWRDDSGPQRNWMELVEPAREPSSCFLSFGCDWWSVSVTPSVHPRNCGFWPRNLSLSSLLIQILFFRAQPEALLFSSLAVSSPTSNSAITFIIGFINVLLPSQDLRFRAWEPATSFLPWRLPP